MSTQRAIALLGRKDEPTDAVEEYCRYLGAALTIHEIQLEIHRFPWEKIGWPQAFTELEKSALAWRNQWVLVQYTALAWSSRGFPLRFLRVLKLLKSAGARVAIVFHDVESFPGSRVLDRLRRAVQIRTMRKALPFAGCAVFTVAPEKLTWLVAKPVNAVFIPVGPNLPIPVAGVLAASNTVPTIGVFSITGGEAGTRETTLIVGAVSKAAEQIGKLRLSIFGRHAELRENELRHDLKNVPVELSVEGVVDPDQVVKKLSVCDLLLFVRGAISSRRSSAIAGIACGLPVIALRGAETAAPVTEAGVILIPSEDPRMFAHALVQVLSDATLRAQLASRSRAAYQTHFSWPAIAARYAQILGVR
jgi:glycosyltransferase involved in cell wall biosynthesis